MKQKITLLFVVVVALAKAQISGSLNLNTAPKETFIGEFSGFNDGMFNAAPAWGVNINHNSSNTTRCGTTKGEVDNRIYDMNISLKPRIHRFPGGEVTHNYNRYQAYGFGGNNSTSHLLCDLVYPNSLYNKGLIIPDLQKYQITQRNADDNTIFPFINKITNDRTMYGKMTAVVLNMISHYRINDNINGVTYNVRAEVFNPSKRQVYENITTIGELENSTQLSDAFKRIVYSNIDMIMTFINNGVAVPYVELGNEMFAPSRFVQSNASNYNTFLNGNPIGGTQTESRFWWFDQVPIFQQNVSQFSERTRFTLGCYAGLCRMYINIIKNLRPNDNIRFGIPFGNPFFNTAFNEFNYQNNVHVWNTYMLHFRDFIGFNDVVIHPYFSTPYNNDISNPNFAQVPTSALQNNDVFFSNSLININKYLNTHIGLSPSTNVHYNRLPSNSNILVTEWDIDHPHNERIHNTFLDGYFYSEFLFRLIEANATGPRKNIYEISNHYLFNGQIPSQRGLFNLQYNSSNNFYKRAKYYAHKIMLPIINNTNGYKYVNVPNAGLSNVPNGVKFRAFYKEPIPIPNNLRITPPSNNQPPVQVENNSGELLLYFYNTSGTDKLVNIDEYLPFISTMSGKNYVSYYTKKYAIWSDKLYASRGMTSFLNNESITSNPSQTIQFLNSDNDGENETEITYEDFDEEFGYFTLKKYSIGYIKFKIYENFGNWCGTPVPTRKKKLEENTPNFSSIFEIYPNPAKDNVFIEYAGNANKKAKVQVYSINGQLIEDRTIEITEGVNKYTISTTAFAKGTYIIKLINHDEIKTEKIIIQ